MPKRRLIRMLRPVINFIEFRVLHINDSPERIAGGVFAGIFIAYTPFLGLHIFIGLLAAFLFKVNKFTTLSFVWVNNVFTLIPIYYPAYYVGNKLLNIVQPSIPLSREEIITCLKAIINNLSFSNIMHHQFWQDLFNLFARIGIELTIGGICLGLPAAAIGYYLTLKIIVRHRRRILEKAAIGAGE